MGIELKTNINTLMKKYGGNVARIAEERALAKLQYLGERFIETAKISGNYTNQTGNLRSSIGYAVLLNGSIIDSIFELTKKGEDGLKKGQKLASRLASRHSKGYVLICMAGMEYSIYVALRGYDVIDSGEVKVRKSWEKLLKK